MMPNPLKCGARSGENQCVASFFGRKHLGAIRVDTVSGETDQVEAISDALVPGSVEQEVINSMLPENFLQLLLERGIQSISFDEASVL